MVITNKIKFLYAFKKEKKKRAKYLLSEVMQVGTMHQYMIHYSGSLQNTQII